MQYDANRQIGLAFGESTVRFIAALGAGGNVFLEKVTQLANRLIKEFYYAGRNVEPMDDAYITQFNKTYDAEIAKQ